MASNVSSGRGGAVGGLVAAAVMLAPGSAGAQPGDGIHLDQWMLVPFADANYTRDSNVYRAPDGGETSDQYFEAEVGLRFMRTADDDGLSLEGNVFGSQREYQAEVNRNSTSIGEFISLRQSGDRKWRYEASQAFRRADDIDRHVSDIQTGGVADDVAGISAALVQDIHTLSIQRDVHQFGAAVERFLTDKTAASLSYLYSSILYDDDQFLDLQGHVVQLDASRKVTDRTSAFVSLRQGLQEQEGLPEATTYSVLRAGMESQNTDKFSLKAGAGYLRHVRPVLEGYETDAIAEGNGRWEDATASDLNFDVSFDWFATEKITVRGGAYNGVQMSSIYGGNAMEYISGWIGAGWRVSPTWMLTTRATYRADDYLDPVPGGNGTTIERKDDRADLRIRADYTTRRRFFRIYGEVLWEKVDSTLVATIYDGFRVSVGGNIRY